jgi:hypothetical protein
LQNVPLFGLSRPKNPSQTWVQFGSKTAQTPGKTKIWQIPESKTSQPHSLFRLICKTSIPGSNPGGASNFILQATADVAFSAAVSAVTSFLTGFNVSFTPSDGDHHLGNLDVRLSTNLLNPTTARVTATFGLRDWNGNWDDRYEGRVFFAVVGE